MGGRSWQLKPESAKTKKREPFELQPWLPETACLIEQNLASFLDQEGIFRTDPKSYQEWLSEQKRNSSFKTSNTMSSK